MRYRGQEHTLKIRLPAKMLSISPSGMRNAFEAEYTKRYGHSSENVPIDLVNLRVVVTGIADKPVLKTLNGAGAAASPEIRQVNFDGKDFIACAIWQRGTLSVGQRVDGPAIIEEGASTTLVGPKDFAKVDRLGNIHITVGSDQ
jgi:N-methylhydantoinase A